MLICWTLNPSSASRVGQVLLGVGIGVLFARAVRRARETSWSSVSLAAILIDDRLFSDGSVLLIEDWLDFVFEVVTNSAFNGDV